MFQLALRFLLIATIFLFMNLATNTFVFAESAVTCHCFKDRAYNPENRFAADEYILAATFNSLISKSFDISKKQIVLLKMKEGVRQEDLLIGLKISRSTNESFEHLIQLHRQNQAWSDILKDLMKRISVQADTVLQVIQSGVSDKAGSFEVADQIISNYFKAPLSEIKRFRLNGFDEREITLIFLLAKVSGKTAQDVADLYSDKEKSWSEIAHVYNLEPSAAGKTILGKDE